MSVTVNVVGQTAVSVSVAASTSVSVVASGGIGPAGFITVPGTATSAFGTFQLQAGDGITVSTANGQFLISSYPSTSVSSLAPVQSVAGRTGTIVLQASDVTAGTFAIGRIPTIGYTALSGVPVEFVPASHTHDAAAISSGTLSIARVPTISYTALSNTPATFSPSAHTHSTTDVVAFTAAASAAAPVQSVQSRTGAVVLTRADITAAAEVHTHAASDVTSGTFDIARIPVIGYTAISGAPSSFPPGAHTHSTTDVVAFTAAASAAAPVQSVAGRTGAISLAVADVSGLASVASSGSYTSLSNVPATFSPSTHTHSTTEVIGLTATFSQTGHVHPYVQTLNGLTGTVTIAGGSGVTVSTASSSITIAASGSYSLPVASSSVLGGIKVGSNLTITDGVLAATGGGTDARWDYFKPPAPPTITAVAGDTLVNVSWTLPNVLGQTPITGHALQYSIDQSTWTTVGGATHLGTSVVSLTNGYSYWFRAASINGIGQGAWRTTTAAVIPDPPGNPILTASGLYAWYDASVGGSLYDAQSGGNIVTSDGGLIYRLADQSGFGRHLYTFDNGSSVPRLALAVKNGKNGVLFDNSSRTDQFRSAANRESGSFSTGNPLTVFAVWYVPSGVNDTYLFDDVRYSWYDREYSTATGMGLAGGSVYANQPGQVQWTGTNTSRAGTWMVVRSSMNGTASTLTVNGVYDAPGGSNSNPGGSTASAYNFNRTCADIRMTGRFTLGELIFFSGALDGTTCSNIESYLMTKWAIS